MGPTKEKEFLRSVPPVKMTSTGVPGQFCRDVHRVRDDRQVLKISQRARDRGRCSAGIKNEDLPFLHFLATAPSAMRIFS